MNKRKERRRQFVISSGNATEIFEPLEKTFDLVTVFVIIFAVFLGICLVFTRWNTSKSAIILNICENLGSVITSVG